MKFRLAFGLAALAAMALVHPTAAQERAFESSVGSCAMEVRGSDKALLMSAEADGSVQIGLMFKSAVDTPGRTREGYFYMGFDFSTSGPVTYRDGFGGDFDSGYIADMSVDDLVWMLDEAQGRFRIRSAAPTASRRRPVTISLNLLRSRDAWRS